ncbi:hypothetical protein [Cryptosporangium phraense]|uniref:Uncharacterized protein n=1 Tax=Cryptosporangium phraense TaxID=2593070 RepID=A0A545B0E0_9ACTN|nr:hypothetical protein [Cryptosporangium phraense]TQS47041.1 hypothetical protein FL583_01925 [Cryptosporangium phraense]
MDEQIGTDIDGYSVVAGHWPLIGPYSPVRTAYASQALTALVSYLNHAVSATDGLTTCQDADRVLAAVQEAVTTLPAVAEAAADRRREL